MKCAYCEHRFSEKVKTENCQEVFQHIRENHPNQWNMVKPKDIWAIQI